MDGIRELAEVMSAYHRRQVEIRQFAQEVATHTIMTIQEAYHFAQIGLTPDEERIAIALGTPKGSGSAILDCGYQLLKMRGSGDE